MKSIILALVSTLVLGTSLTQLSSNTNTSLQGKVTDANSGEPILFGTVALMKDGNVVKGVETDLDGNYYFSDINPGIYDVEASYVGYSPARITDVIIKKGLTKILDLQISEGVLADEIVITQYKVPLIEFDMTTSGSVIVAEDIRAAPKKTSKSIEARTAGITSSNHKDKSKNYHSPEQEIGYPPRMMTPPSPMEYHEDEERNFNPN